MNTYNPNTIKRDGNTWYRMGGGFITWSPEKANQQHASAYVAARVGTQEFWCEDARDLVYSFSSLVNGWSSAPRYMRTLANRVKRDIARDQQNTP